MNMKDSDMQNTSLYKAFLDEREEIMRHKWLESEKNGFDIGFERALSDWRVKHRAQWMQAKQANRTTPPGSSCGTSKA